MDCFKNTYGFYPKYPIADAGYGSYNNYIFREHNGIEKYMKFPIFKKETKKLHRHENSMFVGKGKVCAFFYKFNLLIHRSTKRGTIKNSTEFFHSPFIIFLLIGFLDTVLLLEHMYKMSRTLTLQMQEDAAAPVFSFHQAFIAPSFIKHLRSIHFLIPLPLQQGVPDFL